MVALTTRKFLSAVADPHGRTVFFVTRAERDTLNRYLDGHCVLCGMAVLIRIMTRRPQEFLGYFGVKYKPWLDAYLGDLG